MNTFSTRTRRGAAILFSGVLVLGGLTLASRATAGEEVDGNPTCSSLGYEYGYKSVENPSEGYYTVDRDGMDANLQVGTYFDVDSPNSNNAILGYSISTSADGYAVVVKGGNGATVYRSGPNGLDPAPLHAPAVASGKWPTISHFQLCWNGAPEPGQLEVTKTVVGTDAPEVEFEICVTPVADGDTICKMVEAGETVTFESLSPGDYVVTETDPGPQFSVEGSGVTVTVDSETTATATVTNTWIPPSEELGRVEVTKALTGAGAPDDDPYEICLTGPDTSTTKACTTIVGDGIVAFENLVPGIYTVSETDPGDDYQVTITPTTVEVTAGETATAIVTNRYIEQQVLPPPPEVMPPTVPVTPETPVTPVTPVTPETPAPPQASTAVAAQTTLPTTGNEGGLAAIALLLVGAGTALTWFSRRRDPQEA